MNDYITVRIDKEDALNMLIARVEFWTDDDVTRDLFTQYYSDVLDAGCFDDGDFSVSYIVDNDYINNYKIGTRDDIAAEYGEIDESRVHAQVDDYILYLTY